MLSREIPRLYDNISDPPPKQYGAYYANSLHYVINNSMDNVPPLCILRSFSKYAPFCYQSSPRYGTGIYANPKDCFLEEVHGVQGVIFVNSAFGNRYPYAFGGTNFVGTGTRISTNDNTSITITGNTSDLSAQVIVGFDRSHYVIVPRLTVMNDNGNRTTYNINDYLLHMTEYPYIVNVPYDIIYKENLMSSSTGTDTGFQFVYSGGGFQSYCGDSSNEFTNNYEYLINVSSIYYHSNYLFYPPDIYGCTRVMAVGGLTSYCSGSGQRYSNRANEARGTHSIDICGYVETSPNNVNNYGSQYYITIDTLEKILNTTGFIWANSRSDVADYVGKNTTSNNIHVPQVEADGTTTENSWSGTDIYDNWDLPNTLSWESDITSVDINAPVDKPSDIRPLDSNTNELEPTTPLLNGLGVFASYYTLTQSNVISLSDFLWNADESIIDDIINSLKLFGQNPISAIMSLRLYPFNIYSLLPTHTLEHIILGRVDTEVNALKIPNDASTTIDLGSMYIKPYFNDFRDYSPYSSYNVYIPFIGTIDINPNDFLGRLLSIKMIVDISTGKATAILYADGIPMQYLDGMIGVEIPITAENMGQTASAVIGAIGSIAGAVGMTAAGNIGIGAEMVLSGVNDVLFSGVALSKTGNISPASSLSMPINAYMIVSRPNTVIPSNYGHTKGFVCDMSSIISNLSGFTICYNVDTSGISATEKEKEEIKRILEEGVYL